MDLKRDFGCSHNGECAVKSAVVIARYTGTATGKDVALNELLPPIILPIMFCLFCLAVYCCYKKCCKKKKTAAAPSPATVSA